MMVLTPHEHMSTIMSASSCLESAVFFSPEELRALVSLTLLWTALGKVEDAKRWAEKATDLINNLRKVPLVDGFREMVIDQEEILEGLQNSSVGLL